MSLRIRIEHGQDAGRTWRLAEPGGYVLGRGTDTSIRVLDMKVSKAHARVEIASDGRILIRDLESRHGTLLNGQPLHGAKPLHAGDELRLGLTILRVLSEGDADAEAQPTVPPNSQTAQGEEAPSGVKPRKTLPPDALVGQDIGGYKVLKKIGQGGMGSVYAAEQLSLHREVALKVLSDKFTSDRAFVDQFVNEARSAAALNHPNVVQVYDVGREKGHYYFSMEYVSGGSLEEKLKEEGSASWQDALNWMIDASNALIFAAKRDILHRDVKPDNLMIAEDGSAKLCDLGLAKKSANEDMLAAGIIGTPAFISPEAIRRRRDIDSRSDLYSLGCTFYRLLTGQNPYPGKSVKEILVGHLKSPVPRVSAKVPDVPRELDDVIFKLMQKEPEERYESPEALLNALDRIRIQHGLEAHGIRPGSRKPLLVAGAVVVVLLAGLIFLLTRPKPEGPTGPTPEEIAKREADQRRLREQQREIFVTSAEASLSKLQAEKNEMRLGIDNFTDPHWEKYAGEFETLAKELRANEDYGEDPSVVKLAEQADADARKIHEGVELRRRLSAGIKQARQTSVETLETELAGLRKTYDEALAKNEWIAAARLVTAAALEKIVEPYRSRKIEDVLPSDVPPADRRQFEGELLLDAEEHILPLVEKYVPGEPPGQTLRTRVEDTARTRHDAEIARAEEAATPLTHAGFAEARSILQEWLDFLPKVDGDPTTPVGRWIQTWRQEARYLTRETERSDAQLLLADLEHDRKAWVDLVKELRKPGGLFFSFRLDAAGKRAAEDAEAMRHPEYAAMARRLERDARALDTLMQKIVASYPDDWADTRVEIVDERGRPDDVRVRGVNAQGVDFGDGTRSWARLGPAWIVGKLLFPPDEEEPRIALDTEDQLGVAVLAELAGDYDRAVKAYQAYLATLDAEDLEAQKALRARLGDLGRERRAAEAWKTATTSMKTWWLYYEARDPQEIGAETFWEDEDLRKEALDKKAEALEALAAARAARKTLTEDPALKTTIWATVLRPTPDLTASFAGEAEVVVPEALEPPEPIDVGSGGASEAPPGEGGNGGAEAPPGGDGTAPPGEGEGEPEVAPGGDGDEPAPPEEDVADGE